MNSSEFGKSGKNTPCPVCDRTKDSDCRIREFGNIVLCHTHQDGRAGEVLNGYKFLRTSTNGAGWGVWVWDAPKPLRPAKPAPKTRQEFFYCDRNGSPLVRVTRVEGEHGKKDFFQSTWAEGVWINRLTDEARAAIPVYRYLEVREAIASNQPVFWVEGEGVADSLWDLGIAATTTIGGSKGFGKYGDYSQDLAGAQVVICPDRDQVGLEYALQVEAVYPAAKWCYAFPKSPLWENVAQDGGLDIGDWIAEGADRQRILAAIEPKRSPKQDESSERPDFNEILDEVDLLETAIANDSELEWELQLYAHEKGLAKLGVNGSKLLRYSRARRDGAAELKVESHLEIMQATGIPKMLVGALIPQGVAMVIGAFGGTGKTTLLYDLARHIALGTPWSGYSVTQGNVLIIQCDEPRLDINRKLRAAKFHDVPEGYVDFITSWRFTQFRQLERLLKERGYVFCVIDSWTSVHAGMGLDLSKSFAGDDMYLLRNLANETNCTFSVIHHLNKAGGYRDSSTIEDNPSEVWKLSRGSSEAYLQPNERLLEITKSRSGLEGKYKLTQIPEKYGWRHDGPFESADSPGEPGMMLRIQDYFVMHSGQSLGAKDIAQHFEIDFQKAELELRRLETLGVVRSQWVRWLRPEGDRTGFWTYSLNDDSPLPCATSQAPESEYGEFI